MYLIIICLLNLQRNLPDERTVIFVVSTTGHGDSPDSIKVVSFNVFRDNYC